MHNNNVICTHIQANTPKRICACVRARTCVCVHACMCIRMSTCTYVCAVVSLCTAEMYTVKNGAAWYVKDQLEHNMPYHRMQSGAIT